MLKPIRPLDAAPTELLDMATVREHLKIDTDTSGSPPTHPDDTLITALITAARESAEAFLNGRIVVNQDFEAVFDAFEDEMDLQAWPVNSITSITYVDADGATQTLGAGVYFLDNYNVPATVRLGYQQQWPSVRPVANAIKVTFNAGSTDTMSPDDFPCPLVIKQAMLLTIGHLYENRQDVVATQRYELPLGVKALLQPHRINMGM